MLDSCPLTLRNACNSKAYTFRRELRLSEGRRWRTIVQDVGNGSGDGIVGAPPEFMVEVRQKIGTSWASRSSTVRSSRRPSHDLQRRKSRTYKGSSDKSNFLNWANWSSAKMSYFPTLLSR